MKARQEWQSISPAWLMSAPRRTSKRSDRILRMNTGNGFPPTPTPVQKGSSNGPSKLPTLSGIILCAIGTGIMLVLGLDWAWDAWDRRRQ